MNKRWIKLLVSIAIIMLFSTTSKAAMMQYSFDGLISLEKLGGDFFNPVDQTPYQDVFFNVTIFANTDNINTRNLSGLGTNYYVDGISGAIIINNIGVIALSDPRMSAIPGVGVAGFSWGNINNSSRGSASFSGTSSYLTNEIFGDSVFLRQDWFNDQFNSPFLSLQSDSYKIVNFNNVTYSVSEVPLPPSIILLVSGILLMFRLSKKI